LLGVGGSGKTRLALAVADHLRDHYADVWFVALKAVSDPALVIPTVASTLGLREAAGDSLDQSLKRYLGDKQALLVLDNFEQVLTAAPQVASSLTDAPRLTVLVTSREVLHIYGEQEYHVPTLALPQPAALPHAALAEYAAVALFVERARLVQPDFALTP
jgi:predicted ATPase